MSLQILNAKETLLSEEEIRAIAEIEIHPKVRRWDTDIHTENMEENYQKFRKFFDMLPMNKDQFVLIAKIDRKVVGFLGIHRMSGRKKHVGDVGIMIHPDYQRRGVGTELLKAGVKLARKKSFKRLEADTLADNKAMRRIAEKAGFKLEGFRKMRIRKGSRYLDEALMAIVLT